MGSKIHDEMTFNATTKVQPNTEVLDRMTEMGKQFVADISDPVAEAEALYAIIDTARARLQTVVKTIDTAARAHSGEIRALVPLVYGFDSAKQLREETNFDEVIKAPYTNWVGTAFSAHISPRSYRRHELGCSVDSLLDVVENTRESMTTISDKMADGIESLSKPITQLSADEDDTATTGITAIKKHLRAVRKKASDESSYGMPRRASTCTYNMYAFTAEDLGKLAPALVATRAWMDGNGKMPGRWEVNKIFRSMEPVYHCSDMDCITKEAIQEAVRKAKLKGAAIVVMHNNVNSYAGDSFGLIIDGIWSTPAAEEHMALLADTAML